MSLSVFVAFSFNSVPFGSIKSLLSMSSKFPIKPEVSPLYFLFTSVSQSNRRFSMLIFTVITKIQIIHESKKIILKERNTHKQTQNNQRLEKL